MKLGYFSLVVMCNYQHLIIFNELFNTETCRANSPKSKKVKNLQKKRKDLLGWGFW